MRKKSLFQSLLCLTFLVAMPLIGATIRVLQTNSGGDNIHVIDPATNKVVGIIKGIELNHGAVGAPDGSHIYISNEVDETLDVVDSKSLKVTKQIKLSGEPNNIDISKDGKRVYVAIIQAPGAIDVIDTATLARVKTIPTKCGIHNVYVTPDGKWVVGGCTARPYNVTVVNQATETLVWELPMKNGVRPMAFSRKADGSTDKIFANLSALHGFEVIDFDQRKVVQTITLPNPAPNSVDISALNRPPSHALAVSPDGKTVWCGSAMTESVWGYTLPDLKLIGGVRTGVVPNWFTFTPNGVLYVANTGSETVSAVDINARKVIATIPVGSSPKRIVTVVVP